MRKLLEVLHALVEQGNTVVVIEHNLEVIKTADWILDLGPEGGDKGGEIVAEGTPEEVAKEPRSYTGAYLKPLLDNAVRVEAVAAQGAQEAGVSGQPARARGGGVSPPNPLTLSLSKGVDAVVASSYSP